MSLDNAQIRHRNFMKLFAEFIHRHPDLPRHGMLKAFAQHLAMSDRYISHIKCNRKNIGANVARAIEARLRLPHGWMDREHETYPLPINDKEKLFVITALAYFRAQPVEKREHMMQFFQNEFMDVAA